SSPDADRNSDDRTFEGPLPVREANDHYLSPKSQLPPIECLREPARRPALQPPQAQEGHECLAGEPVLVSLRAIRPEECVDLPPGTGTADRHIDVWLAQAAIPFWNLVLENRVIAKRRPDHLIRHPVVLVPIGVFVRKNQVRANRFSKHAEVVLQFRV